MVEKNLNQRLILIGVVIVCAVLIIWPPTTKLRPGLDIAGGTSMIFEIDADEDDNPNLAEQMKTLLQKRVDPQGVYDLVWRVVGRNRLEVQMPLAPPQNARLRDEFLAAQEDLFKARVTRKELEDACRLPADRRAERMRELADGSSEREKLLLAAAQAYDQYIAASAQMEEAKRNPAATQPASEPTDPGAPPPLTINLEALRKTLRNATEDWENAVASIMDTNFDPARFQDLLELDPTSPIRRSNLEEMLRLYPNLREKIETAIARHSDWRKNRVYLESPADLQRLLRGSGRLEFRILVSPEPGNESKYDRLRDQLAEIGPRTRQGDTEGWFKIDNPMQFFDKKSPAEMKAFEAVYRQDPRMVIERRGSDWFVLAKLSPQDGLLSPRNGGPNWKLKRVGIDQDRMGRRCVRFELDAIGGAEFRTLTRNNRDRPLCILVDDVAFTAPNIKSEIGTTGVIEGDFSAEKIRYLIQTMEAGSLPGKLKDTPVSERTIGSSLGQQNLQMAFRAGLIGLALVLVIMVVYYMACGAVANVALLMNILLVLAAMALIGARFNLAGIAGIILGIGMAVDANVLIYERMREEKERGGTLRMIIKNGYDKAFSTIFDSNITTLLTCAIIYYVGSEEIKGFGLTLGWGVVLNLFTAVFVTRTLFGVLVKYGILKEIRMMKLIGVPNIDWYGLRKVFIPLSLVVTIGGLALLVSRGTRDTLDVEFLGGVSAEVQVKESAASDFNDVKIRRLLDGVGRDIASLGRELTRATVEPVSGDAAAFRVSAPNIKGTLLAAMVAEPLEDGEAGKLLERGGVEVLSGQDAIILRVKEGVTAEKLRAAISALADTSGDSVVAGGHDIARANVGEVLNTGEKGRVFNITTVEKNRALVQYALVSALGDALQTQPKVLYRFRGEGERPYPIVDRDLARVVPGLPPGVSEDLTDFLDGAAFYYDELDPPQTVTALRQRIRNMRLQPDYADLPHRELEVFGVRQAGVDADGQPLVASFVLAVADPAFPYREKPDEWWSQFAVQEKQLVESTLNHEQTLRRVNTFKGQIAAQSQTKALLAMLLAWAMIIAYVWIRFGKVRYGLGGVVALIHDVCVALAFVGLSGWIGGSNHPIGRMLLIEDFKIDMTIIAALLTIIGFSINDTIVIFDRIRETRGRLGILTPQIINRAINETLSRTILTTFTVLVTILAMYLFGGPSIRGFAFCMLIGAITGAYSTLAIATPILLVGRGTVEKSPAVAGRLAPA